MAERGRKPAHAPGLTRQALWAEMRRLKQFTVPQLCQERNQTFLAYNYLRALEAGGFVRRAEQLSSPDRPDTYLYILERDVGIDAPRLRRDGSVVTQGLARAQIWRCMQILRDFSAAEIQLSATTPKAPVNVVEVKRYISHLHRAGYLTCIRPSRPGVLSRYRLIRARNTGPRPPMVQSSGNIYDPNLNRVVWYRPVVAEQEGSDG